MEGTVTANDDAAKVPVEVELVPDSVDPALRIPGAIAAAAIAPTAVLAFMTSDDGASPYSDPASLRAGDSGAPYASVAEPSPEMNFAGPVDVSGADGGE